jgi:hypothetical protein
MYVGYMDTHLDAGKGLVESHGGVAHRNAAFSLLLPGTVLYFKALNSSSQRKFRDKGNKPGARQGWELLQDNGLGKLKEIKPSCGTDFVSINAKYIYFTP